MDLHTFSAGEVIFSIFTITFAIYGFICFLRKIFPSRTSTLDAVDTYEPVNTDIADYMKKSGFDLAYDGDWDDYFLKGSRLIIEDGDKIIINGKVEYQGEWNDYKVTKDALMIARDGGLFLKTLP
ncbi:hypothetical protein IPF86_00975 [Candidatus Nomurabacteria bacterium]|jgi:hypothetical protein|nr:MAG: hypothetical protein IPF86_00975 [Candidatus Nomurabacteria bacterium]